MLHNVIFARKLEMIVYIIQWFLPEYLTEENHMWGKKIISKAEMRWDRWFQDASVLISKQTSFYSERRNPWTWKGITV